ncbi:MAG: hypothetical protein HY302_02510 [Opitutae bacterium]|nr:hypothetical protein [Opitutae bacterium]
MPFPTRLTALVTAASLATVLASAAAPAPAPARAAPAAPPATASAVKTEGDTVVMPKFEVSATRIREIDKTIKQLEKMVRREKQALEKSTLDDTVNSEKVSKVAALFGGKSTVQRASVSAVRIQSMEKEISILETLRTPMTAADRALAEKLVAVERTYRRELDIILR